MSADFFAHPVSCVLVGDSSNAITTHKRQKNKKSEVGPIDGWTDGQTNGRSYSVTT